MRRRGSGSATDTALKKLRLRLMLVTFLVVSLVSVSISAVVLSLAEAQLEKASWRYLNSSLDSVVAHLSTETVISNTWLVQQEISNQAMIFISDGGTPFQFPGVWSTPTDRDILFQRAKAESESRGLSLDTRPLTFSQLTKTTFEITGDQGERYYAGTAVISSNDSWQSVVLIKDLSYDTAQITGLRLACGSLFLVGIGVLLLLSWLLSGRAIRPIRENTQRQTEFVAAASHELKSPLAVISASVSALGGGPQQDAILCDTIQRESARMGRLVQDLLLLAQSDAGTWSVELGRVDLEALCLSLTETFSPIAAKKHQNLLLDLPEESLPSVTGDPQRLEQLVGILLDNACSYTQEGGEITLAVRPSGHKVFLSVKDNGPGIAPEAKARIFERFYRADPARKSKEHSGLGLSIAQELARLHSGRLYLEDQPGYSTVFVLELPRADTGLQTNRS